MLRSKRLDAVIGAAVGGIAIVILAILYYRQRGHIHRQYPADVGLEHTEPSHQPTLHDMNTTAPILPDTLRNWSPISLLPANLQTNSISPSSMPMKSGMQPTTSHVPTSLVAVTSRTSPKHPSSDVLPPSAEGTNTAMPLGTSSSMSTHLTEEQSELIQGLLRHNVPLPAVVGVMEGLLSTRGQSGAARLGVQSDEYQENYPPDYAFV